MTSELCDTTSMCLTTISGSGMQPVFEWRHYQEIENVPVASTGEQRPKKFCGHSTPGLIITEPSEFLKEIQSLRPYDGTEAGDLETSVLPRLSTNISRKQLRV